MTLLSFLKCHAPCNLKSLSILFFSTDSSSSHNQHAVYIGSVHENPETNVVHLQPESESRNNMKEINGEIMNKASATGCRFALNISTKLGNPFARQSFTFAEHMFA